MKKVEKAVLKVEEILERTERRKGNIIVRHLNNMVEEINEQLTKEFQDTPLTEVAKDNIVNRAREIVFKDLDGLSLYDILERHLMIGFGGDVENPKVMIGWRK